jgi:hypothetical protein
VDVENYKQLMQFFTSSTTSSTGIEAEGTTIMVGGEIVIQDGEETGLLDITEMPARGSGLPSPDGSGDYSLRLTDCQNQEVATYGFSPDFSNLEDGLDYASFLFNLTVLEEPCVIKLLHGTEVLSEVVASNNKPRVSVVKPSEGSYAGEIVTSWSGDDADSSDGLTYSVYYSQDAGTTWDALALGTKGLNLTVDTADFTNCQECRIKVIAHDGFFSDEALSDTFSVTNPPEVTWVWPADGYMDAGRMTEISAVFRDNMNASTIGISTFNLKDEWGNAVSGTVAYNDIAKQAVFTPDEALSYGRTYTAKLDGSIKDTLGQSLGSDVEWTFRVELGPFPVFLPIVMGQ